MPDCQALSDEQLKTLRSFDTPTVCNVIELFDVRPHAEGYMDGRIRAMYPDLPPMVGYAVTATFRASSRPADAVPGYERMNEIVRAFEAVPGPAVVVFQDLDDPPAAATYGEMMALTFKSFGAAGLITSGAGRDIEQVAPMNLPCFTGGVNCSHGCHTILETGGPVTVGGCAIRPGDLLHGDVNGVTTIPNEIAAHVAEFCQPYADCEAVLLDHLKQTPDPDLDELHQVWQQVSARIGELRAQVTAART